MPALPQIDQPGMNRVVVVAPHADDETLGCGGTLLRHRDDGDQVHWVIVTQMSEQAGYSKEEIRRRSEEVAVVSRQYGFKHVHNLTLPVSRLDVLPMADLVSRIGAAFQQATPEIVYLPYRGDVHTDHALVFDAAVACTKWFRFPFVRRILAYETLSETDFSLDLQTRGFRPNVFVDITNYINQKVALMNVYETEVGDFPFPRSEQTIRALASLRGAACGVQAAEAFMLLRERI